MPCLESYRLDLDLGDADFEAARFDEAEEHYQHAAAGATGLRAQADALLRLARVHAETGEYLEAMALFQDARTGYDELGERVGSARCVWGIAAVNADRGLHRTAELGFLDALDLLPPTAPTARAECLLAYANALIEFTRYADAAHLALDAERAFLRLREFPDAAECLLTAGEALVLADDPGAAERLVLAALTRFRAVEAPHRMAACRAAYAEILARSGKPESAIHAFRVAAEDFLDCDLPDEAADCEATIAVIYRRSHDYPQAAAHATRAYTLFAELGQPLDLARVDFRLAEIRLGSGDWTLRQTVNTALPAVLFLESQRFQFVTARSRLQWSATIQRELRVLFEWVHRLGDAGLLTELIDANIDFGAHALLDVDLRPPLLPASRHRRRGDGAGTLPAGVPLPLRPIPRTRADGAAPLHRYYLAMDARYGS